MRAIGKSFPQASCITWSYRKRGNVHRIHIKKNIKNTILPTNHNTEQIVPNIEAGQGEAIQGKKCHPPKNNKENIAEPITIWAYSAKKKNPNLKLPYSV